MLIRDVRPWGGERSDVQLDGARIAAIRPHDPQSESVGDVVEGRGRLLFPSFSDVHVHLDSTRIGLPFRRTGATPRSRSTSGWPARWSA